MTQIARAGCGHDTEEDTIDEDSGDCPMCVFRWSDSPGRRYSSWSLYDVGYKRGADEMVLELRAVRLRAESDAPVLGVSYPRYDLENANIIRDSLMVCLRDYAATNQSEAQVSGAAWRVLKRLVSGEWLPTVESCERLVGARTLPRPVTLSRALEALLLIDEWQTTYEEPYVWTISHALEILGGIGIVSMESWSLIRWAEAVGARR